MEKPANVAPPGGSTPGCARGELGVDATACPRFGDGTRPVQRGRESGRGLWTRRRRRRAHRPGRIDPEALVIQTDGKIVLVGTSSDLATAAVGFGLARYNPDGTLDSSFGTGGRVLTRVGAATAEAHAVALQPDGDIVVAGSGFAAATAASNFAVARYTPDGSLDPGFGTGGGVVLTPMSASGAEARGIALQSDGRIVVAGTAFASGTTNDALALARYNADGSPDLSFGSGGSVITSFDTGGSDSDPGSSPVRAAALVIQPDGKLVAVGSVGGHQGAFALARYPSIRRPGLRIWGGGHGQGCDPPAGQRPGLRRGGPGRREHPGCRRRGRGHQRQRGVRPGPLRSEWGPRRKLWLRRFRHDHL